ncbi:MAG: glutathione S-transferase family protein [Rhodospirillaceae bacterium]|nr:glutathione S-transferase family protein [Rhodospirillaceae bacterium]
MAKAKKKSKSAPKKTMKLFYSPIHGFIHKVLVVAHEAKVWDRIEFVPIYPMRDGYSIAAINPLHKVPTLALKDGTVLYGSQTIVEYLDSLNTGKKLYPKPGPARWDALRRLALADTMFEVTVNVALEKGETPPRQSVFNWYWPKIVRALDQMEADAAKLKGFDVGQAGTLHALSYLDRQLTKGLPAPTPPGYDWRAGRPRLTAWWNKTIRRPSVKAHFNKDYKGVDTADFAQAQIAEVLRAQGKKTGAVKPQPVDYVAP